jgi:hypothetical protein
MELDKYGMVPCKFSRDAFGGGDEGEMAAARALEAHEKGLRDGVAVRVYRGRGWVVGRTGIVDGEPQGRVYTVKLDDGMRVEVESRNLETL